MDRPSWQRGVISPCMPTGEALEDTADTDEDICLWEEYIEYVAINVVAENFNPIRFKSNAEKTVQAQAEEKLVDDMPPLFRNSGHCKYKCTEPQCGKIYSAIWDAKNHIKLSTKDMKLNAKTVEGTSAKEATC